MAENVHFWSPWPFHSVFHIFFSTPYVVNDGIVSGEHLTTNEPLSERKQPSEVIGSIVDPPFCNTDEPNADDQIDDLRPQDMEAAASIISRKVSFGQCVTIETEK